MADKEEKTTKVRNATNDCANWEQRIKNELESCHKWNESWGEMFSNGIPFDYEGRIKSLQGEVDKMSSTQLLPKYGVGKAFKEIGGKVDHRRKKMYQENFSEE